MSRAGEMGWWLRALAAPPEDTGLIPSTHLAVSPHFQGDLTPSSGFCGHQAHTAHRHKYR